MAYEPGPEQLQKYYDVVSQLNAGATSLKKVLSSVHLGHETFDRINDYLARDGQGQLDATKRLVKKYPHYKEVPGQAARRVGLRYQVDPVRFHFLTTDGSVYQNVPLDAKNASLVGTYWNEVDNALRGKTAGLKQFQSIVIRDITGQSYQLLTDIDAIRFWLDSMTDTEQAEFWRTLYRGRLREAA